MTTDQKNTLLWANLGVAAFAAFFVGVLQMLDGWPGPLPDPNERVGMALKLSLLPVGFIATVGTVVAVIRLISAGIAPLNNEPRRWQIVDRRVFFNTLGQTVMFLPLFLATAMLLQADESAYLTALPVTFVTARIIYWIGYRISDLGRVPGMVAGVAINLAMVVLIMMRIFENPPGA